MTLPSTPLEARLRELAREVDGPLRFPTRLTFIFGAWFFLSAAALLARGGTGWARAGAVGVLVTGVIVLWTAAYQLRRRRRDVGGLIHRALRHLDVNLAARVRRAYHLIEQLRAGEAQGSHELAELHLEQLLSTINMTQLRDVAARARRRRGGLAFGVVLLALGGWFTRPWEIIEGVDVLLARHGQGLFPIPYVESLEVTAEWPAYLDGTGKKRPLFAELTAVPQGAELEVRVVPLLENRALVLSDGLREVPLVSDGHGGLVGRWVAEDPTSLKVAARFGDVLLFDLHQTRLDPLDDRAPDVVLAGAPAEISLAEMERLPLSYMAGDDHGLTQVDLVMFSGQRSVREELAHLDGQTRMYRGAHTLTREHEMLRRAFLPVHVRIEAKDGNTATGPSWGKSREIILLPEPLGAEASERHRALRVFRRSVTQYFADEMDAGRQSHRLAVEERAEAHQRLVAEFELLEEKLRKQATSAERTLAFLRAQLEALGREGAARASAENVTLAVDALIHSIAHKEATELAKELGQSVEELAVQIRQLRFDPASVRVEGLRDLLEGDRKGAQALRDVGLLGLDLGSVAAADLERVERLVKEHKYALAEAAALHLAERLKRATPSFSSSGGASVESGASGQGKGRPGSGASGPASDAPSEFEKLAQEMQGLAQDNAGELSELERMMQQAEDAARADFSPSPELKRSVEEMREALAQLPLSGRGPGSASSEAALGRSQGEAAADAVEAADLPEALARGREAQEALRRAAALAQQGMGWLDQAELEQAQQALQTVLQQIQKAAERSESASDQLQQNDLSERAARQRELAERARRLEKQGQNPQSALPQQSVEALRRAAKLMDKAAERLGARDVQRAHEMASEAQRELEQAMPETDAGQPADESESNGEGDELAYNGKVPDAEKDRAKDFHERVERGLGRGSGSLSPAVRRYAEDLK